MVDRHNALSSGRRQVARGVLAPGNGDVQTRLPPTLDGFVAREQELAALASLLESSRLVTITGPSGVGKTRVARQLATSVAGNYRDDTWWVELAPVSDPALVPHAMASALSLHEEPAVQLSNTLLARLRLRHMLVVLDNAEHVVEASADLVESLLRACPAITIVVTSQEPLAIPGEARWPLAPLSTPDPSTSDLEALAASPAVQLFCARAATGRDGFSLTAENATAVGEVCRRLDGLPLAIELAAARVPELSPAEIALRLNDRFRLLTGGRRTSLSRHHTLRRALDWSYDLLSGPERVLLRRLAVFVGGATLDAIEEVCASESVGSQDTLDLVASLVSKSLVRADTSEPDTRYHLLETIRQYGLEHLVVSGEAAELRSRHLGWFLQVSERAEPELTGPDQQAWLDRLEAEHDNLRAALAWGVERNRGEVALRLTSALTLFWRVRGYFTEGRGWLDEALAAGEGAPDELRARALWGSGFLSLMSEEHGSAVERLDEARRLWHAVGNSEGVARSLLLLGNCAIFTEPVGALQPLQESVAFARQSGDFWCLSHALALCGLAHLILGDPAAARPLLEQCVSIARDNQEFQGTRIGLSLLGDLALRVGDYDLAETTLTEALEIVQGLGDSYGIATTVTALAGVAAGRGDYPQASELVDDALAVAHRAGNPSSTAAAMEVAGWVSHAQGDLGTAQSLFEQAVVVAETVQKSTSTAVVGLGRVALARGDHKGARVLLERALITARITCDKRDIAKVLQSLGELAREEDDDERATSLLHEALSLCCGANDVPGIVESLEALAGINARSSSTPRLKMAALLFAATESLRRVGGYTALPAQRNRIRAELAVVRNSLTQEEFEMTWAQGLRLSAQEAAASASRGRGPRGRPSKGWPSLTPTEHEIALLVSQALSNKDIAERLRVSPGTVKGHLLHIFSKLGVSSRLELARQAQQPR